MAAYIYTCVSPNRRSAIEASRRLIAYYGRLPHYQNYFAQEGFEAEARALASAWAANDAERACGAVHDQMVATLSVSGTPDDVVRQIEPYLASGLKQIVLYPYGAEGDTRQTILDAIDAFAR